jgi:predicted ATP-dependent serine protease
VTSDVVGTSEEITMSDAPSVAALLGRGLGATTPQRIVATGFEPLDSVLGGGLRTGDLTLLGGAPGIGKSVTALQWARAAATAGVPALYACYEHDLPTLLTRLLLLEVGELAHASHEAADPELRRAVARAVMSNGDLDEVVASSLVLRAAKARLAGYGDSLFLLQASPTEVDVETLDRLVMANKVRRGVLVVDHIQKVQTEGTDIAGIDDVAAQLKDLAMRRRVAVLGVVGAEGSALGQRRIRLQHLQDAAGLGYEADLIVMMNDKIRAVSRRHTAYDALRADEFRGRVVYSIEKNRSGPNGIDLDHRKDFVHYRIDPEGGVLEEQLVDGVMAPD